ncbi:hypothetical protein ACFJIX_21435 [Roseateles sp. UC29_93]|uniref:hypothetical protein n=1 Tax=Roseateles sp. UC29_93 TaxID=3350177 RepID=UPI003670B9FB
MTRKQPAPEVADSHPLLRAAAFIVALIGAGVAIFLGPFAFTRFFGITAMLVAVVFALGGGIPISLGESVVGVVRGWKKAFVCVPLIAVGLYIAVNAEKVTCWSSKSKHLCAAKK